MIPMTELETIAAIAATLAEEYIYEDWEGTGKARFDPFGRYQPALIKKLSELSL